MDNWKTTSGGVVGVIMAFGNLFLKFIHGEPITQTDMALVGAALSAAYAAFHAKDKQ